MPSNEQLMAFVTALNDSFWEGTQDAVSPFTFWTDGVSSGIMMYGEGVWDTEVGNNPEIAIIDTLKERICKLVKVLKSKTVHTVVWEG